MVASVRDFFNILLIDWPLHETHKEEYLDPILVVRFIHTILDLTKSL